LTGGGDPGDAWVVGWRLADLAKWLWDELEVSVTPQTLGRELRAMSYGKLSARPQHRWQKPQDIAIFRKSSSPVWRKSVNACLKEPR
jgi:hypothetical protein